MCQPISPSEAMYQNCINNVSKMYQNCVNPKMYQNCINIVSTLHQNCIKIVSKLYFAQLFVYVPASWSLSYKRGATDESEGRKHANVKCISTEPVGLCKQSPVGEAGYWLVPNASIAAFVHNPNSIQMLLPISRADAVLPRSFTPRPLCCLRWLVAAQTSLGPVKRRS